MNGTKIVSFIEISRNNCSLSKEKFLERKMKAVVNKQ